MGAAKSFEELYIYQRARELAGQIYKISKAAKFERDFVLAKQIRSASISVMSNIAEGFERGSKCEFVQFLYIAKGSCGEIRAQLQVAQDQKYVNETEYNQLLSAMISNFIGRIQTSEYQSQKVNRPKRLIAKKIQAEKR